MENAPRHPGGVTAEQAPFIPDIEPVTAHVTGPQGIDLGEVDVVAPANEVTTSHGAEQAAKNAVYLKMGAGPVTVEGRLTNTIVAAGLAKVAALGAPESAVQETPEEVLQAALDANDSAVESLTAEADQVDLSLQEETEQDADSQLVVAESSENEDSEAHTERIIQLSSHVGDIALPGVDIETPMSEEEGIVYAEQDGNTSSQSEAIGWLVVSATTSGPEQGDDSLIEDGEEPELQQVTYVELQDRANEFAMNTLGELAMTSPDEAETIASSEDITPEFSLTIEDMALLSLAAYEQHQESKTAVTLAV